MNKDIIPKREPDYIVPFDVYSVERHLGRVLGHVFVAKSTASTIIVLYPKDSDTHNRVTAADNLRLQSPEAEASGFARTVLRSKQLRFRGASSRHWGSDAVDNYLVLQSLDLTVENGTPSDDGNAPHNYSFWITHNPCLEPWRTITTSFDGSREINREADDTHSIEGRSGSKFVFETASDWHEGPTSNSSIVEDRLVANCTATTNHLDTDRVKKTLVAELDDCLLIVGVASRIPTACYGWSSWAADGHSNIECFRRDRSFPQPSNRTAHDGLIDPRDFDRFMEQSIRAFATTPYQAALRSCAWALVPSPETPMELRFLHCFSALEEVLAVFREQHGLDELLSKSDWTKIRRAIREFAGKQIGTESQRFQWLSEKLPELNRPPSSAIYDEFCRTLRLNLTGIWPAFSGRASLYKIRNRIVHGNPLPEGAIQSLYEALRNLQWLLERTILTIAGWPITDSDVSVGALPPPLADDGFEKARTRLLELMD